MTVPQVVLQDLARRLEPGRHLNLLRGLSPTTWRTSAEVAEHAPRHLASRWARGTETHWVGPLPGSSTAQRLVALSKKGLVERRSVAGQVTWLLTSRGEDVLWHASQEGLLLPTPDDWFPS